MNPPALFLPNMLCLLGFVVVAVVVALVFSGVCLFVCLF